MAVHKKRFRLYIDESGDHTHTLLDHPGKRYLGLTGVILESDYYRETFHPRWSELKQHYFPHSPDEPVILHRKEIVQKRGPFRALLDPAIQAEFDRDLLSLFRESDFRMMTVALDKKGLAARSPGPHHPYHYGLEALLERYCEFLHYYNACGDVMAESRGGREDRLLKEAYQAVYAGGTWFARTDFYHRALTSGEIKIHLKEQNIAGLQLADLLAKASKNEILFHLGKEVEWANTFDAKICGVVESKYYRRAADGKVEGYGKIFIG